MVFYCALYLLAMEYKSLQLSRGEVLLFRRKQTSRHVRLEDEEAKAAIPRRNKSESSMPEIALSKDKGNSATFVRDRLVYEVKIKKGWGGMFNDVEGWIKPGTLTALMVSI